MQTKAQVFFAVEHYNF